MNIEMKTLHLQKTAISHSFLRNNLEILSQEGVYIIRNYEDVQYVGCSRNLANRLSDHIGASGITNFFAWTDIDIIFCKNCFEVEKFYIEKLKPEHNGGITTVAKIKNQTGGYHKAKRATFIVKNHLLAELKNISYWERIPIQELINSAFEEHIKKYTTHTDERLRHNTRE